MCILLYNSAGKARAMKSLCVLKTRTTTTTTHNHHYPQSASCQLSTSHVLPALLYNTVSNAAGGAVAPGVAEHFLQETLTARCLTTVQQNAPAPMSTSWKVAQLASKVHVFLPTQAAVTTAIE